MRFFSNDGGVPGIAFLLATLLLTLATTSGQAALPDFEDVTGKRLSGDPNILNNDPQEKDVIAADLDKDGDNDVIVVRKVPFSNPGARPDILLTCIDDVLTEVTDTLAPDLNMATDARDVQVADLDGDTWLDVVIANTFDQEPVILMNQGGLGNWQGLVRDDSRRATLPSAPMFCSVGVGDVTGNGAPDLYFSDYENGLEDRLWINDGNGFFTDETTTRIAFGLVENIFGTGAEIYDMNGDGWDDIVVNHALENVHILINDQTGNFPSEQILDTSSAYMFMVNDLTGNDRFDIYVVQDGQDRVLKNNSTNPNNTVNFTTHDLSGSPRTAGFGGNVDMGDVDRDGDLDVYVADIDVDIGGCDREAALLENPGNGHVTDPYGPDTIFNEPTFDGRLTDIDGDGWLDLYAGWCDGTRLSRQMPPSPTAIATPQAVAGIGTTLSRSTPNPFRTGTTIEFELGSDVAGDGAVHTTLHIYDVQGRMVRQLVDGALEAGVQAISWDGRDAAGRRVTPGVYFYRLEAGDLSLTRKVSIIP